MVVAHTTVYPRKEEEVVHCKPLTACMLKVEVAKVIEVFVNLKVDNPPETDCDTLGKCKGYFVMWRKELIRLVVSPTRPSLSLPTTNVTPNIHSTLLDYVDPLPFSEDMDTNQGAGDETAIEKEQHIPETQPSLMIVHEKLVSS